MIRVVGTPGSAEPLFGLAERLGAVVDEDRQGDHVPQHRLDRNRVPADALAMHHRVLGAGDQAGHRHADAEDRFLAPRPVR